MPLPWLEKPELDLDQFYQQYEELVGYYLPMRNGSLVQFWERMGAKLAEAADRKDPYTWRYPQGVYKKNIKPSQDFARAVAVLLADIDGLPVDIGKLERVEVYASRGVVQHGSIIMGKSRICANRACNRVFVPNVPWRKLCPLCSPVKK